ncbi:CBS domain-containing protein [Paucisalibacillus globulus]|jgi:CBS domain-containing protein|uniref:CBS domain-containing protein n=1 Tax=Paucisalibacillus globulus TaxID=351095 RepID=UPI000BB98B9E|nr:CBS domain-containing protein [Paucisalibacillus globulus]
MKVRDFMIQDVITVTEGTTIRELLEILVTHKIGGVPVVSKENKLVGMISDGDVIRYLKPNSRTVFDMFAIVMVNEQEKLTDKLGYSLEKNVSNLMKTKDIKTVKPDSDLDTALAIFSRHHFKKIPVLDREDKVVGVISRGDLLRHITMEIINKEKTP